MLSAIRRGTPPSADTSQSEPEAVSSAAGEKKTIELVFKTLTVNGGAGSSNLDTIGMEGTVKAAFGGEILGVETDVVLAEKKLLFSATTLSPGIAVAAGQIVQVTVVISFS